MKMLIDTYSAFLSDVYNTAESILDDLALDSEALKEFNSAISLRSTQYTDEEIQFYHKQIELQEWFKEMDEADRIQGAIGEVDSSILPDNFWN